MSIQIEILEHGVTGVLTSQSGEASISRYTETYCNWNIHIMRGRCTIIITYIPMDMVIVIYECGSLYKLTYIYA